MLLQTKQLVSRYLLAEGSRKGRMAEQWKAAFRQIFNELPSDYSMAATMVSELRSVFQSELATAIEPMFNAHMKSLPIETHQERQALASWVNHELHNRLRLTIRCPRTGQSAILFADKRGTANDTSRFRLEIHDESKSHRRVRTYTSTELPHLELMDDPPRREGLSKWQSRRDLRDTPRER